MNFFTYFSIHSSSRHEKHFFGYFNALETHSAQNAPEFIGPICLSKPKSSGFQWKSSSLGVRSPWCQATDICLRYLCKIMWYVPNLHYQNKSVILHWGQLENFLEKKHEIHQSSKWFFFSCSCIFLHPNYLFIIIILILPIH